MQGALRPVDMRVLPEPARMQAIEGRRAMTKQQPMLMESPLTKRVYVVTSYVDNGDGTYIARQKYDVTEQFDALAEQRKVVKR